MDPHEGAKKKQRAKAEHKLKAELEGETADQCKEREAKAQLAFEASPKFIKQREDLDKCYDILSKTGWEDPLDIWFQQTLLNEAINAGPYPWAGGKKECWEQLQNRRGTKQQEAGAKNDDVEIAIETRSGE